MQPTLDTHQWTKRIDELTQAFRDDFGKLSLAELNRKPSADAWSVAQNIHHLIVINRTYFPIIEGLHKGTYKVSWLGRVTFIVNFFGNFVLKSVQPDRRRKMKTFKLWEPSASDLDANILQQFVEHQEKLKGSIISCQGFLRDGVVIASPANKNIVYKLSRAFDIIVAHEQRHLAQAREVVEIMKTNNL